MRLDYRIEIDPLSAADGGYFARVPDLPGCVPDGEAPQEALAQEALAQEALANVAQAIESLTKAATAWGRPILKPTHSVTTEH